MKSVFGVAATIAASTLASMPAGPAPKGRVVRRDGQPMANLSHNHPDFGCTPAEHARRKAARKG